MSWRTFADRAAALDAADSLAPIRLLFDIPKDVVYFDGNSLGPMTIRSREVLDHTINVEWRERLIRSWNEDWLAMPLRIGNKIAPIIGAAPDTVIACDNTSINLHKALMAAVALRPGRTEIVVDINNFPAVPRHNSPCVSDYVRYNPACLKVLYINRLLNNSNIWRIFLYNFQ